MEKFTEIFRTQLNVEKSLDIIFEKYETFYFSFKYALENEKNVYSLFNQADEIYQLMQNLQNI